jgi:hypothetical protein
MFIYKKIIKISTIELWVSIDYLFETIYQDKNRN